MSGMYNLPAYMPLDAVVQPIDVMYSLPPFHANASVQSNGNGCPTQVNGSKTNASSVESTDPVKSLELKQNNLIKALANLSSQLTDLIKQATPSAEPKQSESAAKEKKPSTKESSPPATVDGQKKDKDAKKEARKAAKADARAKVATGDAPPPKKGKVSDVAGPWTIREEKQSPETGLANTACLPPKLANFNKCPLGNVAMTVRDEDLVWFRPLVEIASKRNVAVKGVVTNNVDSSDSTIQVAKGDKLYGLGAGVTSRVVVWKTLGLAMGLFSKESQNVVQAAHYHQWLTKLDASLSGVISNEDVIREASKFLSSFDTLGSQFTVGIADVVLRSLLPTTNVALPNNVELWRDRVDAAVKA